MMTREEILARAARHPWEVGAEVWHGKEGGAHAWYGVYDNAEAVWIARFQTFSDVDRKAYAEAAVLAVNAYESDQELIRQLEVDLGDIRCSLNSAYSQLLTGGLAQDALAVVEIRFVLMKLTASMAALALAKQREKQS